MAAKMMCAQVASRPCLLNTHAARADEVSAVDSLQHTPPARASPGGAAGLEFIPCYTSILSKRLQLRQSYYIYRIIYVSTYRKHPSPSLHHPLHAGTGRSALMLNAYARTSHHQQFGASNTALYTLLEFDTPTLQLEQLRSFAPLGGSDRIVQLSHLLSPHTATISSHPTKGTRARKTRHGREPVPAGSPAHRFPTTCSLDHHDRVFHTHMHKTSPSSPSAKLPINPAPATA